MNLPPFPSPHANRDERWKFWRDVAVFQLKMLLDNGLDLVLMPVTLVAALIDLIMKGEREDSQCGDANDGQAEREVRQR